MTSRERFLAALTGKPLDMLPLDINFADEVARKRLSDHYGMEAEEFFEWLGNDVRHTYVMDEIQLFLQNKEWMDFAFKHGYAFPNPQNPDLCFDQWGVGWNMVSDGQLVRVGEMNVAPAYIPSDNFILPLDPEYLRLDNFDSMEQDFGVYMVGEDGMPVKK